MAIFESLSDKLSAIAEKMKGKSRVTDKDIKEMMREIKLALLEADVNFAVVKKLINEISEQCRDIEIHKSLTPGQQIVKVVHQSLIDLLGEDNHKLRIAPNNFTVIMLYGLQGSGKTTTAAKLARMLKKDGKKPFLISVDVHRPAAQEQLRILADQIDVPCYIEPANPSAVAIAARGVERARYLLCDTVFVDTAGRMTVDDELMQELEEINNTVSPTEKLLVVDAMIGQEAVNIAQEFNQRIGIDGIIMTKLDGDARGGAALSMREITGKPIKFAATGEKLEAIEPFHPERMASRILGMGDILSLIEKAEAGFDEVNAGETLERLQRNQFTLEDMLKQLQQVKKLGPLQEIIKMLPMGGKKIDTSAIDDRQMMRVEAIILSMTPAERNDPKILNASRRKRIALGSGTQVSDVNRLIKQYDQMKQMMRQFNRMGKGKQRRLLQQFGNGQLPF